MKQLLLILLFVGSSLQLISAQSTTPVASSDPVLLEFVVKSHKPIIVNPGRPKAPAVLPTPPEVTLAGNVLTFISPHADFALYLLDKDDDVCYEITVPSSVDMIVFPSTIEGDYQLCLDNGGKYIFCAEISIMVV